VSDDVRARSIADVARANLLLGGRRAALLALEEALRSLPPRTPSAPATLLDVGTGHGDIPAGAHALAERLGVRGARSASTRRSRSRAWRAAA
jgi:hypothetical protein